MKTDAREEPLIAVGGGCFLVPERLAGVSEIVHVRHQAVANAVGAAIAQVSGEVDQIFQNLPRDAAIAEARRLAEERAVSGGADAATLQVGRGRGPAAGLPARQLAPRAGARRRRHLELENVPSVHGSAYAKMSVVVSSTSGNAWSPSVAPPATPVTSR